MILRVEGLFHFHLELSGINYQDKMQGELSHLRDGQLCMQITLLTYTLQSSPLQIDIMRNCQTPRKYFRYEMDHTKTHKKEATLRWMWSDLRWYQKY